MTKLPRNLDGESPEQSAIRKVRQCARVRVRPRSLVGPRRPVPPVGLEPTTFGLKVRRPVVVWLEHTDVLIRNWLARCAAIASNSTIAGNASNDGNASNGSSKGLLR